MELEGKEGEQAGGEEEARGGERRRALTPFCALLAAHLALDPGVPGAWTLVTRTCCCSSSGRWTQQGGFEEPGGTVFPVPKTTRRVFFLRMCPQWISNAFVLRSRMNHIVWKVNNHSLYCWRIPVLPWLRLTTFRFYLEVPFLSLWLSMQTSFF